MADWIIVERREVPDRDGARLVFVCERNGQRREATVGPQSWATKKIGDAIVLADTVDVIALHVEGVVLHTSKVNGGGTRDSCYAQMRAFRGVPVGRVTISHELYKVLVGAGVRELKG